ncbi:nucleotidyltransferase [bacterium BFN5]|nr:nucleotidyltransferase [bacterium BFN5]QJW44454.1 nucleotidyltransferase [bacterium BFN5]
MKIVGIIAEYNPFHNGHQWQISQARQLTGADYVICIMSGNFVQRGELAVFDKWKRAEMAVLGGADLVIELPVVFSVRSAQYFAAGGVRLLNALGIVSYLCFGTEHPDINILKQIAVAIHDPKTLDNLHRNLQLGQTYAAALSNAIHTSYHIPSTILNEPNNILAVEYLRSISQYQATLIPVAVPRRESHYHDTMISGTFASATAVRKSLLCKENTSVQKAVPPSSYDIIEQVITTDRGPANAAKLENIILARLRTANLIDLEQLPDVSEGLHYKLQKSALNASSVQELLAMVKSKRYTNTRLQRILIHTLLGTSQSILNKFDQTGPLYARILAFNDRGRKTLKEISKNSSLQIITKTTQFLNSVSRSTTSLNEMQQMLAYDTFATDIYALSLPGVPWTRGGLDFRTSPFYKA